MECTFSRLDSREQSPCLYPTEKFANEMIDEPDKAPHNQPAAW